MANQPCYSIKLLEHSRVSPVGSVTPKPLPLTFLDLAFSDTSQMQRLLFYEFPYSTDHFVNTTLPHLKGSLSLALQHFFPFAATLNYPPPPHTPHILYEDGDSIPFIAAETTADFTHLIGDHAKTVGELQALVTRLPPARVLSNGESTCKRQPVLVIQVTLFPNTGISLGITASHVVADGRAFNHFLKSWASLHKTQRDFTFLHEHAPVYDRNLIQDPRGIASTFIKDKWDWEDLTSINSGMKKRVTLVFRQSHIDILKNWIKRMCVLENEEKQTGLSTFVVTSAYMWVCFIKLEEGMSPDLSSMNEDDVHHFVFPGDCRGHLKLPATYFGNCLGKIFVAAPKRELLGVKGILAAAKAIRRQIKEFQREPLQGAEQWLAKARKIVESGHFVAVAGSPNLLVYETDFGWGKPKKTEVVNIYSYGCVSIAESRDEKGGVEFGLALTERELDCFYGIFEQGLKLLQ